MNLLIEYNGTFFEIHEPNMNRNSIRRFLTAIAICIQLQFLLPLMALNAEEIDFNRHIRPILSDRCFACHGPDEAANHSGFRLDIAAAAKAELPSGDGFALVPGDPVNSQLMVRILSDDDSMVMPPADSHLQLSDDEVQLLRRWVESGAEYSEHWSFVPPSKSKLPNLPAEFEASVRNEIDRFILRRLQVEGLRPTASASRGQLVRRLSLDLTGLPPSSEEVRSFIQDQNPQAYEELVERLLASPHFGERMALEWLDAARYADTNGFSIDGGRHIWLWRDWVIDAFNRNKPFDDFLIEQLAGDLLPDPTPGQLIATGFQRNNMVTHEGGTIPAENLTNYNADRVKTLGESILGLTLGCAQCHDHKYDPISQEDYYGLFAYFNTLDDIGLDGDRGINPRPRIRAKTVLQTGEEDRLTNRIQKLKSKLMKPDPAAFAEWLEEQRVALRQRNDGLQLLPLTIQKISTPNRGSGFIVENNQTIRITQPAGLAAYDILAELPDTTERVNGLRIVFHRDEKAHKGGWGHGLIPNNMRNDKATHSSEEGTFVLTAVSVSAGRVASDQVDLFRLLPVAQVTASSWLTEFRPELCLDMRNINGWSPAVTGEGPEHLTLTFLQPVDTSSNSYLTAQLNFGAGHNLMAAKMEIFALTGSDDGSALPAEIIELVEQSSETWTPSQTEMLYRYFADHATQTEPLRVDLENAKERLRVLTQEFSTMVMNISTKPRKTFILNRGDYSQPTTEVSMKTPDCLPKLDTKQNGRLALAKWITMPNHPLTARVYVNRIWQMLFGAGIVRTPADFGSQGQWPTHPELLDWLAVDFVENNWNIKHLMKKIVLSGTYQQLSFANPTLLERDPQNLLLARGPRFRLPAESIRDSALKTGGLLRPYLGGPSVNPYAPGDLWREISHYGSTPATAQTFVQDRGEKLYRRSLYTYWKRTSPPPNMTAFDAPNRETCVVNRPMTNTPLQALVLLNDVQFVEAARSFAERILVKAEDRNDRQRLEWAFWEALSRAPGEREFPLLLNALQRERKRYHKAPDAAKALVNIGDSKPSKSLPEVELAAWTQIARTIMNLSEFVTRH